MTKVIVADVNIGSTKIKGLMLGDGSFAIAVPQVMELFQVSSDQVAEEINVSQLIKVQLETEPMPVIALSLPEFDLLLVNLIRSGNVLARDFRNTLIGLSLHQLSCDSFGTEFEQPDRQKWLRERKERESYGRSLTDATKLLIDQGEKLNYGYITLQTYQSCNLVSRYREYKATHKDDNFRDTLSDSELRSVSKFEELTADFIMVDRLPLSQAMLNASRYIR